MKKTSLLVMLALVIFAGKSFAQHPVPCGADEMHKLMLLKHPEIAALDSEMERQIAANIKKIDLRRAALRTTLDESGDDSFFYDIPIVIHIIHDYGTEYISDDSIFNYLKNWNVVYAGQNYDTAEVIPCFKKWVGNPHLRLHLATVDPLGNPTKGITRHRSYLGFYGGDQAKFDDWDPTSYVNIWFIHQFGGSVPSDVAAYAIFPSAAAVEPTSDGIISIYLFAPNAYDSDPYGVGKTINHEMGHVFNLYHPWGSSNTPGPTYNACSDGGTDFVDDTPPTLGHAPPAGDGCDIPAYIYDTVCATDYFKVYTSADGTLDSLVNYPDTVNAQNIMDYTYCARMFTKGQVVRMHAALNSDIAHRSNLWSTTNLANTGALALRPDLKPTPEFAVTSGVFQSLNPQYFTCPGVPLRFSNKSWDDTITAVKFNFTNTSGTVENTVNLTANYVTQSFTQPGWVSVAITATGNNSGDSTITTNNCVFVADATATPASDIIEEFSPSQDLAKWPSFNYYNNEFKWEASSTVGFYDNFCMKYDGFDNRLNLFLGSIPATGTPFGDFDDFFSIPVDLTSMATGACNLDFWTAGASRSTNSLDINDTLQISYSNDSGKHWATLINFGRNDIANMGSLPTAYVPASVSDWVPKTVSIPPGLARGKYVIFRFRYKPGCFGDTYSFLYGLSSGNNFYLDRMTFSPYPAEVSSVITKPVDIVVAPNPTSNNAYVIIKDANNVIAKVIVSDLTGKVIYTTSQQVIGNDAHIEIPASAIAVKGVYMVQATTGNQTSTQKLVVY